MRLKIAFLATVAGVALAAVVTSASGAQKLDPGVTARAVHIGGTFPFSGVAALYSAIPTAERAYFQYVNAHGGVNGRRIQFTTYDDSYDPSKSVPLTQKLVEQDKIFADFGSLGTAPVIAARGYLNKKKVPQVLVATGADYWAKGAKQFPWTIGWQPDYPGEARIYAKFINDHFKQAKIGILYQNDAYGTDYLNAFKGAISDQSKIVSAQSYDVTATSFTQQIIALKAAGANTFVVFATPGATITSLVTATKIGWHPTEFVNNVSAIEVFMAAAAKAGADVEGAITAGYAFDPNIPSNATKPPALLAKKILDAYDGGAPIFNSNNIYGLASAWTFVEALKRAGNPPTRAGLMKALRTMNYKNNPWLYPGFATKTTPRDAYPVEQLVLVRYHSGGAAGLGYFQPFSRVYNNVR
jgi:ABC-type branched-subunit amino acid transport system substrate-binding protein